MKRHLFSLLLSCSYLATLFSAQAENIKPVHAMNSTTHEGIGDKSKIDAMPKSDPSS